MLGSEKVVIGIERTARTEIFSRTQARPRHGGRVRLCRTGRRGTDAGLYPRKEPR